MKTPKEFAKIIEQITQERNISHWDAVIYFMEKNNIEPEAISVLIKRNQKLKAAIEKECIKLKVVTEHPMLDL